MAKSSSQGIMKLHSWRPFYFYLILSIMVLLITSLLINLWINKVNNEIQRQVSGNLHQELVLGIHNTSTSLLSPFNQSAINLANLLNSLLGFRSNRQPQFSTIETRVAPVLFEALSTIPHLSQVSFIGLDGLFFSYYYTNTTTTKGKNDHQLFAIYSNTSIFNNFSTLPRNYTWYISPANFNKLGKLYGEPIKTTPIRILDADWFQKAMKSKNGYASPGTRWLSGGDDNPLILNTVSIGRKGAAVSLGYHGKSLLQDFLTSTSTVVDVHGGGLYVSSSDGTTFINQGIPNTRMMKMMVDLQDGNTSVTIQLLNRNGNQIGTVNANFTCSSIQSSVNGGKSRSAASILKIRGKKYFFQCSLFEILGMPSVYVLALPENIMNYKMKSALFLQILPVGVIAVLVLTSMFLMYRAGKREIGLTAQLMRNKEEIQHAERKRMNTIIAYANASHDVRASLAAITGLIQLCLVQIPTKSTNLEINLRQAEDCAKDLLGILNMVLDSSKIEAGKIQLEEEEFSLEQVIEETVDLYYPVGMKKNVDVVLDTCDGSIRKYSKVTGDRGRIKQILTNLLNNAVKFTSEGHISVRVWAKKVLPTPAPAALAAGEPPITNNPLPPPAAAADDDSTVRLCTPCLRLHGRRRPVFDRNEIRQPAMDDDHNERSHENSVEYVFEVSDTGKGIPKEMRSLVFENYVQVDKETTSLASSEHEGTGLGLGIVQTLVRLMGGEISIVDSEKGTCFRFNVFLRLIGTPTGDEVDLDGNCYSSAGGDSFQQESSEQITSDNKGEKSQYDIVVLFISGEERRKVLKKMMRRLGIQVSVVKEYQQLPVTLDKIKEEIYLTGLTKTSSSSTGTPSSVLMVIDTNAGGTFEEVSRIIDEFRQEISSDILTRVAWIDIPGIGNNNNDIIQESLYGGDKIISRPLHGSRAYQLIRRGTISRTMNISGTGTVITSDEREREIQEIDDDRPFSGKKVLIVEDNNVLRRIAVAILKRLGAETFDCRNGEEALQLVVQDLNHQREHRAHFSPPFDCILMDCEMAVMDGYETTRRIREEEKEFGLHISIFALTAHTGEEVKKKITEAGMDYCLFKPLTEERLLEAIRSISNVND